MARPREFDREAAVQRAMSIFWRKGYAATSTDDLLRAMNIGRQSMYDTFGDKHRLYLEALERYQRESIAENIRRLRSTASPLAGIEALVIGIVASDKSTRERGCMGVGSISEFGNTDPDLVALRARKRWRTTQGADRAATTRASGKRNRGERRYRACRALRGNNDVRTPGRSKSRSFSSVSARNGRLCDRKPETSVVARQCCEVSA